MTSIYFAPLEGITGFAFRNTHYAAFASVEKYYTPFTAPNYTHHWKTRDREDVDPAHNKDIPLISCGPPENWLRWGTERSI